MLSFDDFPKNSSENFAKLSILNENLGVDLSSSSLARAKLIFSKKNIEFRHIKCIFQRKLFKILFSKNRYRFTWRCRPFLKIPELYLLLVFSFTGKKIMQNDNYTKIMYFMLTHLGNNYFISVKFDNKTSLFINL